MKIKELKSLTSQELENKLVELRTELFNLRFSHATGNLANPMQLHNTKKEIARIKTILTEREIEKAKKA